MRRSNLSAFFWPLLLACSSACASNSSDTENRAPPAALCRPEASSIRESVFARSCDGAGCHGSDNPALGLDLISVPLERLGGTSSVLCSGWSLVVPGSPEKSLLYQKLLPNGEGCGERMPLGQPALSSDLTQCVADWIRGMGSGGGCDTCGGEQCVALASDPLHCGSCNNACPDGVACDNGSCSCAPGTQACAGSCVDTQSDAANCGACGERCAAGAACSSGVCACPAELDSCSAACVDLSSDAAHCGGCDRACAAEQVCLLGQCAAGCGALTQCGTSCVDTSSNVLNCGSCGNSCAPGLLCSGGACVCSDGDELCGTSCVDTNSDAAHCGACGAACGAGESCVGGVCGCSGSTSVSFKADVAPILQAGCTAAGCHSGNRPKEGLSLTMATSYAELVGVTASQCSGQRQLVVPGQPSSSYLMQKMLNVDVCTGTQMPKAGQSLPAAELALISSWICSGAPNN